MIKVTFITIAIAILGCIPFMGLPGALILPLSKPSVYLLHGPLAFEAATQSLGDKAWPLMIMLTVLWPISIPIAYAVTQKLIGDLPFFSTGFILPFLFFVLVGATAISSLTVEISLSPNKLSDTQLVKEALKNGNLSMVKEHWTLIDNDSYSFDPLFVALDNEQATVANYLLDNGVNPETYSRNVQSYYTPGITPLHTATQKGMLETIKKLLELGADPNATDDSGQTPLHNVGVTDVKMLRVLDIFKENEANFSAVDQDGNTALITLAMINAPMLKQRPVLAQKLIEHGCPRDLKNKDGETAFSLVQAQQPYESELLNVLSGAGE